MPDLVSVICVLIADKGYVGMYLKQGSGNLGGNAVVLHLLYDIVLALAAGKYDYLSCLHYGSDTHGNGLGRHIGF